MEAILLGLWIAADDFCAINVAFTNEEANFWELIESTRIIAVFAIILCKWIPLEFRHRDKIHKVLQQLNEFYPRGYVEQDEIKAKEYAAKIKKFFKISLFLDLLLLSIFNFTPIFEQIYAYVTGKSLPLRPVLDIYYPFDDLKHGNYEILLCFYVWLLSVFVFIILAVDNLFVSISQMICIGLHV